MKVFSTLRLPILICFAASFAHAQWKTGSCTEVSARVPIQYAWTDVGYENCSIDGKPIVCEDPYSDEPDEEPCARLFTQLDQQLFQNNGLCTKTQNNLGLTISCQSRTSAPAPPQTPAVVPPANPPVATNQVQPTPNN